MYSQFSLYVLNIFNNSNKFKLRQAYNAKVYSLLFRAHIWRIDRTAVQQSVNLERFSWYTRHNGTETVRNFLGRLVNWGRMNFPIIMYRVPVGNLLVWLTALVFIIGLSTHILYTQNVFLPSLDYHFHEDRLKLCDEHDVNAPFRALPIS